MCIASARGVPLHCAKMSDDFYGAFDRDVPARRVQPRARRGLSQRLSPGPRPGHVHHRVPAAAGQDAGLPGGRVRFLPHAADPFAGGGEHREVDRGLAAARQEPAAAVDPDLVEAVCLAHDIGHPPFGHAGERVLNALMEKHGGFEGNAQTLRILTRTIYSYADGTRGGMSPTRALLDGVLKYKRLHSDRAARTGEPFHLRRPGAAPRVLLRHARPGGRAGGRRAEQVPQPRMPDHGPRRRRGLLVLRHRRRRQGAVSHPGARSRRGATGAQLDDIAARRKYLDELLGMLAENGRLASRK